VWRGGRTWEVAACGDPEHRLDEPAWGNATREAIAREIEKRESPGRPYADVMTDLRLMALADA
jgi:hypothetical protein